MSLGNVSKTRKSKAIAEGSREWVNERVMALFSLPLMIWLVINLVALGCGCNGVLRDFITVPLNAVLLIMFFGCFLTYTYLALKVVFEDYSTSSCAKWVMILGVKFIGIFTFIAVTFSILNLYFNIQ